ncbi:MAG TPA: TonB-dependent receptor, partial [Vicinamibacterales bacterium]|nr:TonB-dependent receptor [Vicinamibacterales bacterium]
MKHVFALGLSLILAAAPAHAQVSATTGSINGRVTDNSGGVLPGVTVTASSPSMQGVRTDVTNEAGEYRFPAVPPGSYNLVFELAGFGSVNREGLRVGLGFTATVNIELGVANLQETVTVSGQSPVVDISTTTTAENFGQERLASLPNARDFWSVLAASPAMVMQRIDVGGSAAGTQTGYAAYDTKSDQHRPMVEGIVNTENTGGSGFYYDYGSIDEVAIETKGHTAEMPWPGVWSNFVAKSGGNEYHGKLYGDYQNEGIQRTNIDNSFVALCPRSDCGELTPSDLNRIYRYYDLNGDIGGYLKKDTLWWYGSVRNQNVQGRLPNFPVKPFETGLTNYTGKLTYAVSQNNKLTAYAMWGNKSQPNRLDTFRIGATSARHNSADSTWNQNYWAHTYKAGYESVVGDNSFFEVRGGQFRYVWPNSRYSEDPAYQDVGNNLVTGGNRDGWFRTPSRNQVAGSLTYFKSGWAGSHNFKVGGEWFRETFTDERGRGGVGNVPGDILYILNNGRPSEVYLFATPSYSEQGLQTVGLYVQDTWRLNSRLTINAGIRFDRYRAFLPEQEGPAVGPFNPTQVKFAAVDNLKTYNNPVPRLGLIFDLTGEGRTVLKANIGQYYWNPGASGLAAGANPNFADWYTRYAWADTNGDLLYQAGEEGRLIDQRGGVATGLDPNLKNTRTDEFSTWVEHELMPGLALSGGYVYRSINNFRVVANSNRPLDAFNVPVTIRDPGPDGVLGNGDDGTIAGFNLNPANLALPVSNLTTNLPGKGQYHTVEFQATKRQAGRWSLSAAFSKRWNKDHETDYFGQNLRAITTPSTANDLINTNNGRFDFTMWTAKVNGSYDAPYGIRITPALRFQQGQPYGRTFQAGSANGINYGTQRILAEPLGTRRMDNITLLDVRLEKSISLPSNRRIGLFVDAYNLTNTDAAQNITWSSGSAFEQPISIVGPSIMRFG